MLWLNCKYINGYVNIYASAHNNSLFKQAKGKNIWVVTWVLSRTYLDFWKATKISKHQTWKPHMFMYLVWHFTTEWGGAAERNTHTLPTTHACHHTSRWTTTMSMHQETQRCRGLGKKQLRFLPARSREKWRSAAQFEVSDHPPHTHVGSDGLSQVGALSPRNSLKSSAPGLHPKTFLIGGTTFHDLSDKMTA